MAHPNEREWIGPSTSEIALKRVLLSYDFSPDSDLALEYAISIAQQYQAELHLLHVIGKERYDQPEVTRTQTG
ncbi:MAG TPA: universal stress protein, partial [Pyrinomonadaceae bacterium]|nr:universal stress protein [Pyrinomonadaceae bacterium]